MFPAERGGTPALENYRGRLRAVLGGYLAEIADEQVEARVFPGVKKPRTAKCTGQAALKCFKVSFPRENAHEQVHEPGTWSHVMTLAGTPLRRSARPGW